MSEVLDLLSAGECLIEYAQRDGRYRRIKRSLGRNDPGEPEPFAIQYQLKSGQIPFRGTCNVVAGAWMDAMARIAWAPGRGNHAAGKGWRGGVTLGSRGRPSASPTGPGTSSPSAVDLSGYSHYDWCYVLKQGDEIVDVLYCGYNKEPDACTIQDRPIREYPGGIR